MSSIISKIHDACDEFEKFEQTRSLTPDNAKLMIFKNESEKKNRENLNLDPSLNMH